MEGTKKYKSINETNIKKHDKILLLVKSKLNNIEVLISKALNDSNTVLLNSVLKDFYDMKRNQKF